MTLVAVLLEPEEIVFDTLDVRADALWEALIAEGTQAERSIVRAAHVGANAAAALDALPFTLDAVSRSLVLRRTHDAVRDAYAARPPLFDPAARDATLRLALDLPIGVVTRASPEEAMHMLAFAGLDAAVRFVVTLDDRDLANQAEVWSRAARRLLGRPAVALGSAPALRAARAAGLRTVAIHAAGEVPHDGVTLSLAGIDAEFLTTFVANSLT